MTQRVDKFYGTFAVAVWIGQGESSNIHASEFVGVFIVCSAAFILTTAGWRDAALCREPSCGFDVLF